MRRWSMTTPEKPWSRRLRRKRLFSGKNKATANRASAEVVGKTIAERAKAKKIDNVVFDRGGFIYHGKVKALADAAREGGLKF